MEAYTTERSVGYRYLKNCTIGHVGEGRKAAGCKVLGGQAAHPAGSEWR